MIISCTCPLYIYIYICNLTWKQNKNTNKMFRQMKQMKQMKQVMYASTLSKTVFNQGVIGNRVGGYTFNGINKTSGSTLNRFSRSYHAKVIDHYTNPRNVGSLDKKLNSVGTGLVGAPACGDVMKLQIQVDEKTGVIQDVKFKTFGCGSAIASSSYVTELVRGKTLEDAVKIKNTEIAKELSLPPVKLHCSMLAEDAIKAAIKDYKSKRVGTNISNGTTHKHGE